MEKYSSLLNRNGTKVLISGDSLSYNRYDFDPVPRTEAVFCYPGMPSWSTLVLETIYQNDPFYKFGKDIAITGCKSVINTLPDCDEPMCRLINSCTAAVENGESLGFRYSCTAGYSCPTGTIALYLQKRPDSHSCLFDIYLDGTLAKSNVNTLGNPERHQGWERFTIVLPVNMTGIYEHNIEFRNIRCSGTAFITLAGVGSRYVQVYNSGIGNRTVTYFIENFEERIGRYTPDIFIFSIGANDQIRLSCEQFKNGLQKLTGMILGTSPGCKIMYIVPGRGQHFDEHVEYAPADVACKCGKERYDYYFKYNEILHRHAEKTGADCIDTFRLFENTPIHLWRYDNIHLTKYGNTVLAKQVIHALMPDGYYDEKLIDASRLG